MQKLQSAKSDAPSCDVAANMALMIMDIYWRCTSLRRHAQNVARLRPHASFAAMLAAAAQAAQNLTRWYATTINIVCKYIEKESPMIEQPKKSCFDQ